MLTREPLPFQNTSDALSLVGGPGADAVEPTDREFARVKEFLALRAEQREHEDLIAKRMSVAAILERFEGKGGGGGGV